MGNVQHAPATCVPGEDSGEQARKSHRGQKLHKRMGEHFLYDLLAENSLDGSGGIPILATWTLPMMCLSAEAAM